MFQIQGSENFNNSYNNLTQIISQFFPHRTLPPASHHLSNKHTAESVLLPQSSSSADLRIALQDRVQRLAAWLASPPWESRHLC